MSSAAAPGALMPLYDGGYGIVLESSRHKAIVTTAEADTELIAIFQAEQRDPPHLETWTFYSHRRTADLSCFCDDPMSSWCTDGNGSAWRRVRCAT